jgi:RNA polymerase sigma factor (sigma-70 family)
MMAEQDQRISETIDREKTRLRNFIRKRVADQGDAEDILQDVFYELVEAYRMMKPVEQVTAWLFRVARNRITDLFRKEKPEVLTNDPAVTEDGEVLTLEELLPSPDAGPEAFRRKSTQHSERHPRTQLNFPPRRHGHRDRAELRSIHVTVRRAEVDLIQRVEGLAADLEAGLLRETERARQR